MDRRKIVEWKRRRFGLSVDLENEFSGKNIPLNALRADGTSWEVIALRNGRHTGNAAPRTRISWWQHGHKAFHNQGRTVDNSEERDSSYIYSIENSRRILPSSQGEDASIVCVDVM